MSTPQPLAEIASTLRHPSTATNTPNSKPAQAPELPAELQPYEPIPHHLGAPRPVVPPSAAEVRLTEGEVAEALRVAQAAKFTRLVAGLRNWELSNPPAPRRYTAEDLLDIKFREAVALEPNFQLDEYCEPVFWALCLYFAGDRRFNDLKPGVYSLEKGLLLTGGVGRGKSFLMRLFASNPRQGFTVTKAEHLVDAFEAQGPPALFKYYRGAGGRCFDDVGIERPLAHFYKADENTFAKVFLARADAFDVGELKGPQTHFTTNLAVRPDEHTPVDEQTLEGRYYNRVTSRLKKMMNLLTFPVGAPDRRK